ncbi:tyrosine-type recombinase/integrase [Exiguobacterium sp. s57]|uniref:tyrosine-type recombinase/integrase n=1 Tax=Exiguobacterium sp. s57 TaxID=2751258 RepID=UPI001BE800B6|nr:tyrosine-type recombinase/integrase [Exiguobacterium sp. s57]
MIEDFKVWLVNRGLAEKTIESYTSDVRGYYRFLKEKIANEAQGHELTRFHFLRYRDELVEERRAITTINKKINSLKVYNDYLNETGMIEEACIDLRRDQIRMASGSDHQVTALSEREVERLLFFLEDTKKVSIRNKLAVYLLLYTGVRVTELVSIRLNDIDGLTHTLTVRGKGGKVREISLRHDVMVLIDRYVKGERMLSRHSESQYLLLSQRGGRLHRDAIRDWLAKITDDVGVQHLHPHLFRHTFATRLIRKGVDLTTVSRLTGHASVNMTAKYYIQTTKEEKLAAVEKL